MYNITFCPIYIQSESEMRDILLLSSSETFSVWCVAGPSIVFLDWSTTESMPSRVLLCSRFIKAAICLFPFLAWCELRKWRQVVPAVHPQVAAVHPARGIYFWAVTDEHNGVCGDQLWNLYGRLAHVFRESRHWLDRRHGIWISGSFGLSFFVVWSSSIDSSALCSARPSYLYEV